MGKCDLVKEVCHWRLSPGFKHHAIPNLAFYLVLVDHDVPSLSYCFNTILLARLPAMLSAVIVMDLSSETVKPM